MTIYRLGRATVEHNDQATVTRVRDGSHTTAWHAEQAGQEQTAAEIGLAVWQMNRSHDLTHSLLARMLGLPASPTLHTIAHEQVYPHWRLEEKAVLGVQGFAYAVGADLLKLADHYSRKD